MTPSTELFELIRSMNKAEKGYFKKYAQLHTKGKGNSYLALFDAVAKQKEYDEKKLIAQLQKHNFIRQLPYWKNYLYSRILDALENYHSEMNINIRMRKAMNRAELLLSRGLYSHSARLVKKTKRFAEDFGLHHTLLEIYYVLESTLHAENYDYKNLQEAYQNVEKNLANFRLDTIGQDIYVRMLRCYYHYSLTRDKTYLRAAKELLESPLAAEAAGLKSFTGQFRYFETNFFYWYGKDNLKNAYEFALRALSLYESSSLHAKHYVKKYVSTLNNLFVLSIELDDYKRAGLHLQQLKSIEGLLKTSSQKAMFFYHYSTNLLHYLCQTCSTDMLGKELSGILAALEENEKELGNVEKIDLLSHVALSFYFLGDLKKTIRFLNKLRNEYRLAENPEMESLFYLFYMLVHFDAGNRDILISATQSFYRFLKKKNNISVIELSLIAFLRKQSRLDSAEKLIEEFRLFKKILEKSKKSPNDKYIFKYINLAMWLDCKIQRRPFAEIVAQKNRIT